ncbi:MAG TPA: hypothetical protein VLG45_11725 [Thermodesulfobacteriota bacterium]|nr:hypothetical protein [Thermodesulfobacteriota bacterium]
MRYIKVLFIILIILFFAILYTQNMQMFTQEVTLGLDLKFYKIGPYLTMNVVIILTAFAAGAVVAVIFGALQSISSSAESKEKSRRIRELEARNRELIEDRQREEKLKKPDPSPFTPPSAIDSSSHGG